MLPSLVTSILESGRQAGPTALTRRGSPVSICKAVNRSPVGLQSDRACKWESTRNLTLGQSRQVQDTQEKDYLQGQERKGCERRQVISAPAVLRTSTRVIIPPRSSGTNSCCTSVLKEETQGPKKQSRTINSSSIRNMIPAHPGVDPHGSSTPPGHTCQTT